MGILLNHPRIVGEEVEERLELDDRARLDGLGAQPVLHRLLEPLGLAAGGGVSGSGAFLDDVAATELGPEGVLAALVAVAGQPDGAGVADDVCDLAVGL